MKPALRPIPLLLSITVWSFALTAQAPALIQNDFLPPAGTGNWNVAANWQFGIPTRAHSARIPAGTTCSIVTAGLIDVGAVSVEGTLDVPGGPGNAITWRLETDRIDVVGTLSVGSSAPNGWFMGTGEILLTHRSNSGLESKHIEVHAGADLLLYGDPTARSWSRLADGLQWQGALAANPSSLLVEGNNLGWGQTDVLAIGTTDFDLAESEVVTVASAANIGANTAIATQAAMTRAFFSRRESAGNGQQVDMRAAVGRLNRNLRIVGDTTSSLRWGGDIRVLQTAAMPTTAKLSYVEFDRMGKYGQLGRYPLHFHLCGDMANGVAGPRGTVTGCSFHDCFHRALSIHGTHRVEVRDCVAWEIFGHAFFLEDGDETGNLFENNLGMNIRTPTPDPAFTPNQLLGSAMTWPGASTLPPGAAFKFFRYHDQNPAVFWISNYANSFVGNVALGSEAYGFAFDMAIKDFDADGQNFAQRSKSGINGQILDDPATTGYRRFRFVDNTAGGCGRVGFFSDEEGSGRARPVRDNNGTLVQHESLAFERCTAFKCRMAGVWYRQYGEAIWSHCRFADNALGVYFASDGWTEDDQFWEIPSPAGPFHLVQNWSSIGAPAMSHMRLEDALIFGASSNTGYGRPDNQDWDPTLGRSLPYHRTWQPVYANGVNPAQPIAHRIVRTPALQSIWNRGVTIYDGLIGVVRTQFENFNDGAVTNGLRRAAAFTVNGVGDYSYIIGGLADRWRVDPRNYTSAITFVNVPIDNRIVLPAPRPAQQNPNAPLTMGWAHADGLVEAAVHDLDGTLTGLGAGYVVHTDNPLIWRNATGATQVFSPTNGSPLYYHVPAGDNAIAALHVEIPWDWLAAQVAITTGFRNVRLALPSPQQAYDVELYDTTSARVTSNAGYSELERAQKASSKRRYGTNLLVGPASSPPQYDLTFQNVLLAPDATGLAVRLRFGAAGGAVVLKLPRPSSATVKSVWTALPPLAYAGATSGATLPSTFATFFPTTGSTGYRDVTQHTVAASRAALDTMSGNGWWQSGNDLYLRLELPARTVAPGADPVFSGQETIVHVRFY
ncbi:MAG: right-handed parallel beta-helix repeat-containing protein [Planctomycetes bacterium]|nr:right-handed parallel beta-helix repeat-containing protein [Planctomycetota bacterium]